jgi:hypothetical protein
VLDIVVVYHTVLQVVYTHSIGTMDFDETRLYYSHQQLQQQSAGTGENGDHEDGQDGDVANQNAAGVTFNEDDSRVDLQAVRRHFREFLSKLLTVIWIGFVRS